MCRDKICVPDDMNATLDRILQELADTRQSLGSEIADTRQSLSREIASQIAGARQSLAHEITSTRQALEGRIDVVEQKLDSFGRDSRKLRRVVSAPGAARIGVSRDICGSGPGRESDF